MKDNSSAWNLLNLLAQLKWQREREFARSTFPRLATIENLERRDFLSVTNPDLYSTTEDTAFKVPESRGVLVNDIGTPPQSTVASQTVVSAAKAKAKPKPPALGVISADAVSQLGAKVKVNADGSFTYDARKVASIGALKLGQQVFDRFYYTITGGERQYATVVVEGQPDGAEDSAVTTEDAVLKMTSKDVLKNDPGPTSKRTVVSYDPVSALDVAILMTPKGELTYDPTGVTDIQDLAAGDSEYDSVNYTSSDGKGQLTTSSITILVKGANDAPEPQHDIVATDELSPLTAPHSVLFNDSDPDEDDALHISAYDKLSELGATVVMNPDGTYTYDPRSARELNSLLRGESLDDEFNYTVTDKHGISSTSYVRIDVTGVEHPVKAIADSYGASAGHLLRVNTDKGVLANDLDADVTDALRVTASDTTTAKGATVDVYADGSAASKWAAPTPWSKSTTTARSSTRR